MTLLNSIKQSDLVREMTLPLLVVCTFASLGGASFGIDNGVWSGLLGFTQFNKDFGVFNEATGTTTIPATWQSIGTGTPQIGIVLGCILATPIASRFGRRVCFLILAAIAVIGIIVQATSKNYWQLVVGRIINSISMGVICNIVPNYASECSPPKIRGALINFYQFWLLYGFLMIIIANWKMSTVESEWQYRTIILIQMIVPVIFIAASVFCPDSPRWLLLKGRREDALKTMLFLRRGTPAHLVEEEVRLMEENIADQKANHYANSFMDCFKGTNRRRTLIAMGVQGSQQIQGNSFITNYSILFLQSVGVKDTYLNNIYLILVNTVFAGTAFYLADKLGRRWFMVFGALIEAAAMYTVAGLTGLSSTTSPAQAKGALAALFIWEAFQSCSWASCVWIVSAEVGTSQLRERTLTLATFTSFAVGVIVTYISPYIQDAGYGNLQGKIGFIWGTGSLIAMVFVILYVPETKGRSMEDLDEMFDKKVSVWSFGKYQTTGFGRQIREIEAISDDKFVPEKVIEGVSINAATLDEEKSGKELEKSQ